MRYRISRAENRCQKYTFPSLVRWDNVLITSIFTNFKRLNYHKIFHSYRCPYNDILLIPSYISIQIIVRPTIAPIVPQYILYYTMMSDDVTRRYFFGFLLLRQFLKIWVSNGNVIKVYSKLRLCENVIELVDWFY